MDNIINYLQIREIQRVNIIWLVVTTKVMEQKRIKPRHLNFIQKLLGRGMQTLSLILVLLLEMD